MPAAASTHHQQTHFHLINKNPRQHFQHINKPIFILIDKTTPAAEQLHQNINKPIFILIHKQHQQQSIFFDTLTNPFSFLNNKTK